MTDYKMNFQNRLGVAPITSKLRENQLTWYKYVI